MMQLRNTGIVLVICLVFSGLALAQPELPILALTVSEVGRTELPYEAIRLRATLVNLGKKRVHPLSAIDENIEIYCKAPGQAWRYVPSWLMLFDKNRPVVLSAREAMNDPSQFFLDPGQQTSVTFALAAAWRTPRGEPVSEAAFRPLLEVPGNYELKMRYVRDLKRDEFFEASLKLNIRQTDGADDRAYQALVKDSALAMELLRPVNAPSKKNFEKIKSFIEAHPKTNYTPYARFALARAYMSGIGVTAISPSAQEALAAGPRGGYPATSMRVASALAADQLEAVMFSSFPYQPNVLMALRQVDHFQFNNAGIILHRDHMDSIEWLEEIAKVMKAPDWARLRVRQTGLEKK